MKIHVLEKMRDDFDESNKFFREAHALLDGVEVKGKANVTSLATSFSYFSKFAQGVSKIYELIVSEIELEKANNTNSKIELKKEDAHDEDENTEGDKKEE